LLDVLVMLVNNLATATPPFHVAVQPAPQQPAMNGTLSALFGDSPDVPVQNGKFTDSLDPYGIHILYFAAT
jgi:hypothetical protein